MCGICGQYNYVDHAPVSRELVRAMAETIRHRGPDDEGYYFADGIGLGFRRLSIIDLSGGHQPMADGSESVWVAFNGEIYNFHELREELEGLGHVFRTRSDTEVIIHGYKQWGTKVLRRLNGMFGLAIWDARRRRLILGRDAAGIKLVYYRVQGGSVVFGSELRAVLRALPNRPPLDMTALNLFLRYRYTPAPLTLYQGIRKLEPGTMAVFEGGEWRVERWDVVDATPVAPELKDEEAIDELLEVYKRALKRHLISDVPVGLLLSGGVDSGLLLALMNLYGDQWPTYTVGYGRQAYEDDELTDAAETARIFGAPHHPVSIDRRAFEEALPRIVSIVEEPVATSSIVPMYFVCERARQDVKVALVGQGPDELFGGYTRHLGVRYGAYWRAVPDWLRKGLESGLKRLPRSEALKRGLRSLDVDDRMARYRDVFSILPGETVDSLFRPGLLPAGSGDTVLDIWSAMSQAIDQSDELGGFQLIELQSSLPDELLMYADKLSMIHSLEVRVPYLDREIVDYARRLPAAFKIRAGQRKWLHRRVCEKFLPGEILRRKKRGFAVNVVDSWFQGSLGDSMDSYLKDPRSLMFDHLNAAEVGRLLAEHRAGVHDNHKILFSLVVLEEWLRSQDYEPNRAAA
jgi:asparagine synthase (glutamine-hydrolysing)